MTPKKVLVAMSGGVDSCVAAARIVAAGHEAVGVHMALNRNAEQSRVGSRGCCTVEDAFDARRVATKLDIPFYVWDMSEEFKATVMDDFVAQYAAGNTPNPCVRCNEHIKFAELLTRAEALGFDAVATGHYASVQDGPDGVELHRAADLAKDQSYVLAVMGAEALSKCLFPLGDAPDKDAVRQEAEAMGFSTANKPDSHDICFIPDGDTRGFLDRHVPREPGDIVDAAGEVVGQHDGALGYTIGQRRGLRLGRPAPDGKPRYVLDVSVTTNTVTVGSQEDLMVQTLLAKDVVPLAPMPAQDEVVLAQVRAHGTPFECVVATTDEGVAITAKAKVSAIAPGQTVVVYRGNRVLFSATLSGARR